MENTIEITESNIKDLKEAYKKAKDSGAETFKFQGSELVTNYAKYLIEYAEGELKKDNLI